MRHRNQKGSLKPVTRADGTRVWIYRWRERQQDGALRSRKKTVGELEDLPTRAKAWEAVEAMNLNINFDPTPSGRPRLFRELVEHYQVNELKEEDNQHKSFSTREGYQSYLDNHIAPKWGDWRIDEIEREAFAVHVEAWLKGVRTLQGKPMTRGTKAKIRNIMSAVFTHAVRYGWLHRNPIREVRQSAKRERVPARLTADELCRLLGELDLMHAVMVMLLVPTGIRRGEILALQWEDIDWREKTLNVRKSIWHQKLGPVKTEESEKVLPLDDEMLRDLERWRRQTPYAADQDWVFASSRMHGKQPLWPEAVMRWHIRPAAKRAGIIKHVTWHAFRHSFSTLLVANKNDVKTVQHLMRHANSRITLELYTGAVDENSRKAQSQVVQQVLPVRTTVASVGVVGNA